MRQQIFQNKEVHPVVGDTRKVIRKLGFFTPLTLPIKGSDKIEKRWNEIVEIEQVYDMVDMYLTDGGGTPIYGWKDSCFLS